MDFESSQRCVWVCISYCCRVIRISAYRIKRSRIVIMLSLSAVNRIAYFFKLIAIQRIQSLCDCIFRLWIRDSKRCCEFINTGRILCKISAEFIFNCEILTVGYSECQSGKIFFSNITFNCLGECHVSGYLNSVEESTEIESCVYNIDPISLRTPCPVLIILDKVILIITDHGYGLCLKSDLAVISNIYS